LNGGEAALRVAQARFLVWRETLLKSIFKQSADLGLG
jgi:hypothetical protein